MFMVFTKLCLFIYLSSDFSRMGRLKNGFSTHSQWVWVVSTILYLILFDSFWYSGDCYTDFLFSFIRHLCSKKSSCGNQMLLLLWKKEREMRVLLFFVLTLKRIPREKASLSCFYYSLGEIPSDFTWCRIDSKCFYFIYGW